MENIEVILGILSALLGGVSVVFGRAWLKVKGKLGKAVLLLIEVNEVFNQGKVVSEKSVKALEDDKVTPEEVAEIKEEIGQFKKEVEDVKLAWKDLMAKQT